MESIIVDSVYDDSVDVVLSRVIRSGSEYFDILISNLGSQQVASVLLKNLRKSAKLNSLCIKHSCVTYNSDVCLLVQIDKSRPCIIESRILSDECLDLFNDVFKENKKKAFWDWKYRGYCRSSSVAVIHKSELVAHNGLLERKFIFAGVDYLAMQSCDVMIKPSARKFYASSLLNDMVDKIVAIANKNRILMAYGFPHKRHMDMGLRLNLYQDKGDIISYVVSCSKGSENTLSACKDITFDDCVITEALRKFETSLASIGGSYFLRDFDYFKWRYLKHPCNNYRFILSEINDVIFVVKQSGNSWHIMEYIGDISNFSQSMNHISGIAASNSIGNLYGWLNEDFFYLFDGVDNVTVSSDRLKFATIFPGKPADIGSVWVSLGDTDFM